MKVMHSSKAPNLDRYHAGLFKQFWSMVGSDITRLVLDCLNNGRDIGVINKTFITLIPKIEAVKAMKDFHPISLCNVVYKIIEILIASMIKGVLPNVMDEAQSVFIEGRLIMNNIIIAYEAFHCLKNVSETEGKYMVIKLDMSKAYDRIEWHYLEWMLTQISFPSMMIQLIMTCITSVSYQVLINSIPSKQFKLGRGLQQGDPLSPYFSLYVLKYFPCY